MKRELFENVKVIPGGIGTVIDRDGFLSAVIGISASVDENIKLKLEHADTETGTFEELEDPYAGVNGELKDITIGEGNTANICIDLAGCKRYIRFNVEGNASGQETSSAVVLGHSEKEPV